MRLDVVSEINIILNFKHWNVVFEATLLIFFKVVFQL